MVQLVGFIIVLAIVFALKAAAIARTHEELVRDDASFSWMSARPQDATTAAEWAKEQPAAEQRRAAVRPATTLRRARA